MTLTMKRNYGLVLPKNYVSIEKDEMEYVDGGWAIKNTWYGYNIYLTHKERQLLTTGQTIVGFAAGGVGAAIVGALGTIIWNYDDGHGVRIRMTGPKVSAVFTGVFSLTASQEKKIASKNKILF